MLGALSVVQNLTNITDEMADHEELKDGEERHLTRDSPLSKIDNTEYKHKERIGWRQRLPNSRYQ